MSQNELRLAMLISDSGTTARAIIKEYQHGGLRGVEPVCVISSKVLPDVIQNFRCLGFSMELKKFRVIVRRDYPIRFAFGRALLECFQGMGVDLIGQYGWMPRTPENVIEAYDGRMINQHPGPLDPGRPDFGGLGMYGLRVHAARLFYVRGVGEGFWTEATAQRVHREYDLGAVLHRRRVEILKSDNPLTLRERVLPIEHEVQIETLRTYAEDRVTELVREEPLVKVRHIRILNEAKWIAEKLFPSG